MLLQYLESFGAGLLISLTGSIPLGNLNLAAMQIAVRQSAGKALWFSIGVVLVEMAYLAVTLGLLGTLSLNSKIYFYFRVVSIVVLLLMAIGSFRANGSKEQKSSVFGVNRMPLVAGMVMSALNPMQIPFWVGWCVYLLSQALLVASFVGFSVFVTGAGVGTFSALLLFIILGRKLSTFMGKNQQLFNIAFGCIFLLLAIAQVISIFQSLK